MESNLLWTMLVSLALSFLVVGARERIIPVIRNEIRECPDYAVCADVFRSNDEVRSLLNCRCHDHTDEVAGGCPYLNPTSENSVFQSRRHQEVLCTRARDLPICEDGQIARYRQSDFSGRPYYSVYCRCPYHDQPFELANRRKATISGICNRG